MEISPLSYCVNLVHLGFGVHGSSAGVSFEEGIRVPTRFPINVVLARFAAWTLRFSWALVRAQWPAVFLLHEGQCQQI